MPKRAKPKKIGKLEWMTEEELIEQLKALPMDSSLRMLKVAVTDDDCERSRPGHPTSCAVSTAVRRMLPKASYVCTKHHGLTVTINGRYLHFAQSNKGSQAIRAFDERKVRPPALTFTLFNVRPVPKQSKERKEQINEARRKRAAEGRPDKIYIGEPLRLRIAKTAAKAA
jgi:hypothetical protein